VDTDIVYRAPRLDEADAVAALGAGTFIETFGALYSPENLRLFLDQAYAPESIAAELSNPKLRYQIAERDGEMVGLCKIGYGVTLDYDPGDLNIVELKQLYVFASQHGTGIGQILMEWAITQANAVQADAMLLSVYSDNPRGHRFYHRNGFSKVADTYFMVGNHRDEEYLYLRPLR
jgi:diamine N-acetyltransferase